jgi:hypothetical protein
MIYAEDIRGVRPDHIRFPEENPDLRGMPPEIVDSIIEAAERGASLTGRTWRKQRNGTSPSRT